MPQFELPDNLSDLTRAELEALLAEYGEALNELAEAAEPDPNADQIAVVAAAVEAVERVRRELDSRPSERQLLDQLRERAQAAAPAPTGRARTTRPSLSAMRAARGQSRAPQRTTRSGSARITTPHGQEVDHAGLVAAISEAMDRFRTTDDAYMPVARVTVDLPPERTLRQTTSAPESAAIVAAALSDLEGLVAAGGLCAPLAPYYDQLVIAAPDRPMRDGLPSLGAERGGITLMPPPQLADLAASVTYVTASQDRTTWNDGSSTNASTAYTSATAAFTSADVGKTITGTNIPANTTIVAVVSATQITLSQAATATGAGLSFTIVGRGDKTCLHATCPAPVNVPVAAVNRCVEFGNFAARAWPEQVEAWLAVATAYHARRAETALLDTMAANSVATTSPGGVGAAREWPARVAQAAAGYRSRHRMSHDALLTVAAPAWLIDAIAADSLRGTQPQSVLTAAQVEAWLRTENVQVLWYLDSKTGGAQVIGAQGAGVLLTFPATALWYIFAPGTFVFLDNGTLDFGLVRDTSTNTRNDYRIQVESFEALGFLGLQSLEVAQTICVDGSIGAARALACPV